SVEISRFQFQSRQITDLRKCPAVRQRCCRERHANAQKNGKPHFAGVTNTRPVRLRPGSDYLAPLFLERIAITATPKPSRINNGYRIAGCAAVRLGAGGFGRAANSIGILTCEPVPGWKRHCEYASSAAPSS